MSSGLFHLPLEARKGPRPGSSGFSPSLGLSEEVQKEQINLSPGVGPGSALCPALARLQVLHLQDWTQTSAWRLRKQLSGCGFWHPGLRPGGRGQPWPRGTFWEHHCRVGSRAWHKGAGSASIRDPPSESLPHLPLPQLPTKWNPRRAGKEGRGPHFCWRVLGTNNAQGTRGTWVISLLELLAPVPTHPQVRPAGLGGLPVQQTQ